jgi:nitrogen fixation/metabolism regulation signal transduction histidine kinase
MKKRKQYIIDKGFQLRHTFSIIGVVSVITAVILIAITASVVYNNNKLTENNTKITNIYEIENSIFVSLSSLPEAVKDPTLKQALIQNAKNHDRNMETLNRIISFNTTIIRYNKILLASILAIILAESMALYIILIRKTHRISGPIYVISNFMKDIIEGRDPKLRPLRKGDELQDFYDLFQNMVKAIRSRGHHTS